LFGDEFRQHLRLRVLRGTSGDDALHPGAGLHWRQATASGRVLQRCTGRASCVVYWQTGNGAVSQAVFRQS
jgi:hypothetical protein